MSKCSNRFVDCLICTGGNILRYKRSVPQFVWKPSWILFHVFQAVFRVSLSLSLSVFRFTNLHLVLKKPWVFFFYLFRVKGPNFRIVLQQHYQNTYTCFPRCSRIFCIKNRANLKFEFQSTFVLVFLFWRPIQIPNCMQIEPFCYQHCNTQESLILFELRPPEHGSKLNYFRCVPPHPWTRFLSNLYFVCRADFWESGRKQLLMLLHVFCFQFYFHKCFFKHTTNTIHTKKIFAVCDVNMNSWVIAAKFVLT
jgi:hypothetical protein